MSQLKNTKTRRNAAVGGISHKPRQTANGRSCARKLKKKFWGHVKCKQEREESLKAEEMNRSG